MVIGMTPGKVRRRYRDSIFANLSILLIVISVSLVLFFYSMDSLEDSGWVSFVFQFVFYLGISSASWFSLGICPAIFPGSQSRRVSRVYIIVLPLLLVSNLLSSLYIKNISEPYSVAFLVNGFLQLSLLCLFLFSFSKTAIKLCSNWKKAPPLIRIGLASLFILFILAVFFIDVAYGVWSKVQSERELSLFYVFPVFLIVLSILISFITIFSARKALSGASPSDFHLKAFGLSLREQEVAALIIEGKSYRETAEDLCISLATVQSHIRNIYRKTGVKNKIELVNLSKTT